MSEPTPPLTEQIHEIEQSIQRINALLDLIHLANNRWEIERLSATLKGEQETFNRLAKQLTDFVHEQQEKKMKRKSWIIISTLLMALALLTGGVVAQEVTDVPTAEVFTPVPEETEPPIVVTVVITDVAPTADPNVTPVPPDNPPPSDTINFPQGAFVIAIVTLGILLTLFGAAVFTFATNALKRVPSFLRPGIYAGVDSVLSELERIAKETIDTADDEQVAKFRREWERIKDEVDGKIQSRALRR